MFYARSPWRLNASDAEKMVAGCKKSRDKLLMIGFVLRFSEKIEYAKQLVEQGKLGKNLLC
jgi:predicted dehydrogenase